MMHARRVNLTARTRHRGGILFEIVLAAALFGGAASFCLGAMRSVFAALDRTRREHEALDLARSKIAELEAGLISLAELRSGSTMAAHAVGSEKAAAELNARAPAWTFDLKTRRTEFTGLTLVELTVREDAAGDDAVQFTFRQLVPMRGSDDGAYELDDALSARPEEGAP